MPEQQSSHIFLVCLEAIDTRPGQSYQDRLVATGEAISQYGHPCPGPISIWTEELAEAVIDTANIISNKIQKKSSKFVTGPFCYTEGDLAILKNDGYYYELIKKARGSYSDPEHNYLTPETIVKRWPLRTRLKKLDGDNLVVIRTRLTAMTGLRFLIPGELIRPTGLMVLTPGPGGYKFERRKY